MLCASKLNEVHVGVARHASQHAETASKRGTVRICAPQYHTPTSSSQVALSHSLTQATPPVGEGVGTARPTACTSYALASSRWLTPPHGGIFIQAV